MEVKLELDPETQKWLETPEWIREKAVSYVIGISFEQTTWISDEWILLARQNGLIG